MSLSLPLPCWVLWSSLVPGALEIPMAILGPSQMRCLKGCRARSFSGLEPAWGCPGNTICFSYSLKALFPAGGPIRGCMKGLKALGKYVDLKRMSTVGVSYGCTSDLLVSRKPWPPSQRAGERVCWGKGTETNIIPPGSWCRGVVVRSFAWLAIART